MADEWSRRARQSKLASVLYPHLTSQTTQAEMAELSKNELKRAPTAGTLLGHHVRGPVSPLDGRTKS
jgi:hypothetical protein